MPTFPDHEKLGTVRQLLNATGIRQNQFEATRPPVEADDERFGWEVGSRWFHDEAEWVCRDSTPAQAVWLLANDAAAAELALEAAQVATAGAQSAATDAGTAAAASTAAAAARDEALAQVVADIRVPTLADRPATGPSAGYVVYVIDSGNSYRWSGTAWQDLGTGPLATKANAGKSFRTRAEAVAFGQANLPVSLGVITTIENGAQVIRVPGNAAGEDNLFVAYPQWSVAMRINPSELQGQIATAQRSANGAAKQSAQALSYEPVVEALSGVLVASTFGQTVDLSAVAQTAVSGTDPIIFQTPIGGSGLLVKKLRIRLAAAGAFAVSAWQLIGGAYRKVARSDLVGAIGYQELDLSLWVPPGGFLALSGSNGQFARSSSLTALQVMYANTGADQYAPGDLTAATLNLIVAFDGEARPAKLTGSDVDGVVDLVSYLPAIVDAMETTETTGGQSVDIAGMASTRDAGTPTMALPSTASDDARILRRMQIYMTAPTTISVLIWGRVSGGWQVQAEQAVPVVAGYNDIALSLSVPAGGMVGWRDAANISGVNASLPSLQTYYSNSAVNVLDGTTSIGIRFMVAFTFEARRLVAVEAPAKVTDGAGLSAWRSKIARIKAGVPGVVAKVAIGRDSWGEHRNVLAVPLADMLWAEYGQSGTGWLGLYADESGLQSQLVGDARLVKSGIWTRHDMVAGVSISPDGYAFDTSDTSADITITNIRADRIRWYYLDGAGSFSYALDGGSPVAVACGNTGAVRALDLSGLSSGDHSLTIAHSATAASMRHYGGYATMASAGVEVSKWGNGGSYGEQWAPLAPDIGLMLEDMSYGRKLVTLDQAAV